MVFVYEKWSEKKSSFDCYSFDGQMLSSGHVSLTEVFLLYKNDPIRVLLDELAFSFCYDSCSFDGDCCSFSDFAAACRSWANDAPYDHSLFQFSLLDQKYSLSDFVSQSWCFSRELLHVWLQSRYQACPLPSSDVVFFPQSYALGENLFSAWEMKKTAVLFFYDDYIKLLSFEDGAYSEIFHLNFWRQELYRMIDEQWLTSYVSDGASDANPLAYKMLSWLYDFAIDSIVSWVGTKISHIDHLFASGDVLWQTHFFSLFQSACQKKLACPYVVSLTKSSSFRDAAKEDISFWVKKRENIESRLILS